MRWPLVRVTWIDSACPAADWHNIADWEGLGSLECLSVGFQIAEDDVTLTLAPHIGYPEEPDYAKACGIMVIPKGAIRAVEPLAVTPLKRASERASSRKISLRRPA